MTLMYDGKVERTVAASGGGDTNEHDQVKLFRAVLPLTEPTGLMKTPCGVCPVRRVESSYLGVNRANIYH